MNSQARTEQTPQEGLSTRSVSSPIEPRWLQLLCLGLVVCVVSPLGGR
ncbi:putative acetyltransferase [Vibrio cholerae]|nr:putative acetyltransferase [Vibrio cholerae]